MKPVEAKVLEGLRKTTLAYLSDKQYVEVVEAVDKQGILGLTGVASIIVKGAVVKHGSHDQKTHGRGGKGGGGGGGSQIDAGESKQVQRTVESAIKGYEGAAKRFESEADSLSDGVDTTKDMNRIESARKMIDSSMKDFKEAKSLTGDKQRKKLQVASDKFESGLSDIDKIELKNDAVQRVIDAIPSEAMRELGIEGSWDM